VRDGARGGPNGAPCCTAVHQRGAPLEIYRRLSSRVPGGIPLHKTVYDSRIDKAPRLRSLLPITAPRSLDQLPLELFLFDDAQLSVVYAPLDFVNTRARVVLAGLTPGWRQAQAAYAAHAELRGASDEQVGSEIKRRAAFAGSMRTNLIAMLDELDLGRHLGIESTAALFAAQASLVHATSVLRYPVFKAGKNYAGQNPKPVGHPFLRAMLERLCAPELESVPDALIIPLGKAAEEGLEYLTALGRLRAERWLRGFPHPSGANGHRKAEFSRAKLGLATQLESWFAHGSLPPPRLASERESGPTRLAAAL
jgi:hypothetical protein